MMDGDDDLWRASGEAMRSLASTEDYKEGPLAFIEKRDQSGKGVRLLTRIHQSAQLAHIRID